MATHSSILAWEIPWAEESGGLQSMGLQRVGYNWVTFTSSSPCSALGCAHLHCVTGMSGYYAGLHFISGIRSVVSDSLQRYGLSMEFPKPEYCSGWVVPFSKGSSQPRDWTQVSCIAGVFFTSWATRKTTREALYKNLIYSFTLPYYLQDSSEPCCIARWISVVTFFIQTSTQIYLRG